MFKNAGFLLFLTVIFKTSLPKSKIGLLENQLISSTIVSIGVIIIKPSDPYSLNAQICY